MPVLAKFLSTKFVAHSNCSYKDHLFFLLSGEKFLKFYWFDAYEDRFKQPGRVWSRLLDSWIIKKITRVTVSFECSVNYSVSYRYCIPFWKGLDWSCKSICEVINVYLHFVFLFNPSTNYALTKYHLVDSQPLIKNFPIYILAVQWQSRTLRDKYLFSQEKRWENGCINIAAVVEFFLHVFSNIFCSCCNSVLN